MKITISLEQVFLVLIAIGALVAIIYLILFLKNLVETMKKTNKVLEDVQVISSIAAEKATSIDGMVDNVSDVITDLTETFKGNQSMVKALSSIVNAANSIIGAIRKSDK